jgi:hypothetical protein
MSDTPPDRILTIIDKFPFLSYGTMAQVEYLGIIQNSDAQLLSMYVLSDIPSNELRIEFLKMGQIWYWESNRMIPVNVFLGPSFSKLFRPYLKHFSRKDFKLLVGHAVSLQESIAKRMRKRQVSLVRKVTP